jgi:hypothetical protein
MSSPLNHLLLFNFLCAQIRQAANYIHRLKTEGDDVANAFVVPPSGGVSRTRSPLRVSFTQTDRLKAELRTRSPLRVSFTQTDRLKAELRTRLLKGPLYSGLSLDSVYRC